jgi:transposase
MDKMAIITHHREGLSNRAIARKLGMNRKTVNKYVKKYIDDSNNIAIAEANKDSKAVRDAQNNLLDKPSYTLTKRTKRKYNDEIDALIDDLLDKEAIKTLKLGPTHKQALSATQIHQIVVDAGYDIGLTTVTNAVRLKSAKIKETYIRQCYNYGQRLEFDFGEIYLIINGSRQHFYIAVFGAPASEYRRAYLYKNQDMKVFLDAHVRFFEELGGVHKEIVYDNMRNVVKRFIGKSEKELNDQLLQLSAYYGFDINVTNCFSGNEKGFVESSVRITRKQAFAKEYEFDSYEEASKYLDDTMAELSAKSSIEEEKKFLTKAMPRLDLAIVTKVKVSKYSMIRFNNNFYSVPEELNGKDVTLKEYVNDIEVYYNHNIVCGHKKIDGFNEYQVDIKHYLKTLSKKPGAIRNSQALVNNPDLKTIYEKYYTKIISYL